jgi:hypothetical protein
LSLLAYFFFVFFFYQLPPKIDPYLANKQAFHFSCLFDLVIYPGLFFLSNFILFLAIRKHIILRSILAASFGVLLSIARFLEVPVIIDPVYFFVLSTSFAGILGVYRGDYFADTSRGIKVFNDVTEKLIDYARDGYKYLLGRAFQAWLALGASLGVSMSILFRQGYDDPHSKFTALKMLIGFIGISGAIALWVIIPVLNGIATIQDELRSLKIENY